MHGQPPQQPTQAAQHPWPLTMDGGGGSEFGAAGVPADDRITTRTGLDDSRRRGRITNKAQLWT